MNYSARVAYVQTPSLPMRGLAIGMSISVGLWASIFMLVDAFL